LREERCEYVGNATGYFDEKLEALEQCATHSEEICKLKHAIA